MKIYLTPPEIAALHKLKLTGTIEKIRDRFVLGCYSGLRFSDYSRISSEHIQNDCIEILTKKRSKEVVVPLHRNAIEILERHNYNMPPPPTLRYFNMLLPQLCQQAGIREPITLEAKENGTVNRSQAPKYNLVTTHTARRSFATNAYNAGIPVRNIMLVTGHATELSFFMYIQTGKRENARELLNHSFFSL